MVLYLMVQLTLIIKLEITQKILCKFFTKQYVTKVYFIEWIFFHGFHLCLL